MAETQRRQQMRSGTGSARPPLGWRGLLVGSLGALAIGAGCPYASLVLRGSYMDLDFSTPGAIFLLFVLTAIINGILARLKPRWALTPQECIVVYIMMILASAIPIMGLSGQLLPMIAAPTYYASPENKWSELILPHLNPWLRPEGERLITYFFEGSPSGAQVPWHIWVRPLVAWLPFLLCVHFVMIGLMVIARKQWVENERLVYPLTQLPLEMVAAAPQGRLASLYRDPIMWCGFAVPFVMSAMTGLHHYFSQVPAPRMAFSYSLFRHTATLTLRASWPMVGFFYLVEQQTSFSLWFFNLLFFVIRGWMNILQLQMTESLGIYGAQNPVFAHIGMGAFIALIVTGTGVARPHLRNVWRKAIFADPRVSDAPEILSYRAAFWGTVFGLVLMATWLNWSGIPLWLVIPLLAAVVILFVGLTRIVCESGMAEAVAPTIAPGVVVSAFGARAFGTPGLVALSLTYVWGSDMRTFVMASAANSLKMAEELGERKRRLFAAMFAAILLALASSIWLIMTWAYRDGGTTLNSWFFIGGPTAPYKWISAQILHPQGPNVLGWILTGVGALLMMGLATMRQRFLWWPFHPLGFALAPVWIMDQLWLTIFTSWLLKVTILRYGGHRLYHRMRAAFLGLILGQFAANGLWLIVDQITGTRGNRIFWI